ncbi:unnamed protein product [Paramecium octaurelia]|uniref:Uncharacterized protein n=1 Tax=Paramecium octaurelia TaxID=43137 RepID=A0A8S1V834_PAROT|nr:unnamed protein product [Paramecium octaurelia]
MDYELIKLKYPNIVKNNNIVLKRNTQIEMENSQISSVYYNIQKLILVSYILVASEEGRQLKLQKQTY